MNISEDKINSGQPGPLGTQTLENKTNFSIFSKHAKSVTLLLFAEGNNAIEAEIPLDPTTHKTGEIWHISIDDLPNKLLYAYRIDGEMKPKGKNRFDESKFILDPYAKSVVKIENDSSSYYLGVVNPDSSFDWQGTKSPNIHPKDLIIYEAHVKGYTIDPSSEVKNKGTFSGLIEKIPHFIDLGINAIELLPVQEFNEKANLAINPVTKKKLSNYWGYSTLNFFAVNNLYAEGKELNSSITEFKTMVRELHKNGIELILDVVFNHTAEGNELGPTISFKGIDNCIYYILNSQFQYNNYTGCGNTFNCNQPVVLTFILDVLRYFVLEMHVDGFRFDLASIFARDQSGHPQKNAPIIDFISQDPILSQVKLIAEPWDAVGLYHVGAFYPSKIRWSEWNDRYRDAVRSFINGINNYQNKFATRVSGSQDLYYKRAPYSSINFVTCHDGFSLADLVSYNQKHNIENGENNHDGTNNNLSCNFGVEGVTSDSIINALRERQMKNFHVALMVSQGIPMILMGDEYGHTKNGNNNTWCQDNKLNWFLWDQLEKNEGFFRFYKNMIKFRREHAVFRQETFLTDSDVSWHGTEPFQPNFDSGQGFIAFTLIDNISSDQFYIAFNAKNTTADVNLPPPPDGKNWHLVVNTANLAPHDFIEINDREIFNDSHLKMTEYSSVLLKT